MDRTLSWNQRLGFQGVSIRISALSKRLKSIHPPRAFWAMILVLAGIGLGSIAQKESRQSAIEAWEKTHFPKEDLWKMRLERYGFVALGDMGQVHRLVRSLPASLDLPTSV